MSPLAIFSAVVAFFGSKLGRVVGIGLIALAVYGAGELRGRRVATEACKAAAEKAQTAAVTQDRVAQGGVDENTNATLDMLQKQKEKADATVADLQQQLNARPLHAPCLYGPNGKPAAGGVRGADAGPRTGDAPNPAAPVVSPPRVGTTRN